MVPTPSGLGVRETVPGPSRLERAAEWARRELPTLFWAFVICSVAGLVIEEVYHLVVFHEVQSRALRRSRSTRRRHVAVERLARGVFAAPWVPTDARLCSGFKCWVVFWGSIE